MTAISYFPTVKVGDVISLKPKAMNIPAVKKLLDQKKIKSVEINFLENDLKKNVCIEELVFIKK